MISIEKSFEGIKFYLGHYELLQLTNRIDEGTTEETDEQRRINDAYSKNGTYLVNNISYK